MSWRDDSAPAARAAFPPIVVECVSPAVDGGRYPAKRLIGDELRVGADIFKDGHDPLAAQVLYCGPGGSSWRHATVTELRVALPAESRVVFTVKMRW